MNIVHSCACIMHARMYGMGSLFCNGCDMLKVHVRQYFMMTWVVDKLDCRP